MTAQSHPVLRYQQVLNDVYERIARTQMQALTTAGSWVTEKIVAGNLIYTLGSGHSLLVALELYYRAGGLANFEVMHDKTFGRAERLPGYAKVLLETYPITANDLLILVSNSGRNELPVEMALEAKKLGIRTIAITSMAHSLSAAPRTVSGKRLCEVADLVIDNCGVLGDASVEIASQHGPVTVAPTSTAAGVFIANSIVSIATQQLIEKGIDPPVFASANIDAGNSRNKSLIEFMRARVRGL